MLSGAVRLLYRQRRKTAYLGDLVWLCAKAQYKELGAEAFGQFMDRVDAAGTCRAAQESSQDVVHKAVGIIEKFLPHISGKEDETDEAIRPLGDDQAGQVPV